MASNNSRKWMVLIDDRQQDEVKLAKYYAAERHHGTDGHGRLMLIDRLSKIIDYMESRYPDSIADLEKLFALYEDSER